MRFSERFNGQIFLASIILLIGVKVYAVVLIVLFFALPFLNNPAALQARPAIQTQTPPAQADNIPIIQPDVEWAAPLATQASEPASTQPLPVGPLVDQLNGETALDLAAIPEAASPAEPQMISSPLYGISLEELSGTISQDFSAPPTGEDSGHHGVDFAFWSRGNQSSILGLPITAVFPGKVVSAFNEIRLPYGYLVITETPLSAVPQSILNAIKLPVLSASGGQADKLYCPPGFVDQWNTESQSLYVLYGHMNNPPLLEVGQTVNAGDVIGDVGNTGASSAPHLHLEMRIGPSNASFQSLGHYDVAITDKERHDYCTWRVSGVFQMFDPMTILTTQ
jgi:murein DD-endopeptidase MepM/ murein hydrolase activator NlpD